MQHLPHHVGTDVGVRAQVRGEQVAAGDDARSAGPPAPLCARVTARLFPDAAGTVSDVDPWTGLRWCTGRTELPGQPRRQAWQWRGAPISG
ncbi:hypothetical protein AB0H57_30960 [Micromonospora sp. NPDC050686]|uniref:hypothetical protein n=1 Tax=Micromonospora sp. NPDC050686 TaxID=3154631 RepID=UPI0033DE3A4B